ncbi:hypothetical protein JKP88DRAFT_275253 [Tribonema minus]|uniref:Uncharacterized protein n=1 Tax=Tribonema minus TaxID=303371 RepID=A0A835ZB55_9STRA|nr:hypothetical protein JKP88DRAFT_275253 [Tribonema minus]
MSIEIVSDFVENVIDQLAKLVGQIYHRLVDAIGDARQHLLRMLAQAEEHLSDARDTLQRWVMEELLRDRRNRRRSPFARVYSINIALFNELPGDAAMPPPIMRDTNKCERVAATVASFAELPGSGTCKPAPVAMLLMDQSGNVTGTIGQDCARRAAAAIAAAAATTAAAAATAAAPPSPKQHHRRQSSLVGDAVGAVVGLTGAVICAAQQTAGSIVCNTTDAIVNTAGAIAGNTVGAVVNTTGAVVGGVGAIAGGVCRFFFGGSRAEKPQGRGRSATRSLSPKGEGAEEGGREPRGWPARETLQRWIMEELLRDRRNRRRSPSARAYNISVTLCNELPGDAAMPPPLCGTGSGPSEWRTAPVAAVAQELCHYPALECLACFSRSTEAEYAATTANDAAAGAAAAAAAPPPPQPQALPSCRQHHRHQSMVDTTGAMVGGVSGAIANGGEGAEDGGRDHRSASPRD